MALISFLAGEGSVLNDLSGSGLGFYGYGGYGASVLVGAYQDNTYITNAAGNATNAVKVDNIKWMDNASGQIPGGEIRALRDIPNYLATLNIRFTNSVPVKTQNAQLRIFNRSDINVAPTDVVTKVAVLVHPWDTQSPQGSGSVSWSTLGGSGSVLNFSDYPSAVSPSMSGFSPQGSQSTSVQHDWYVAISSLPVTIGSKLSAIYAYVEFI